MMRLLEILQQRHHLENKRELESINERKRENYSRLITDEEALVVVKNQIKEITSKRQQLEADVTQGKQREKYFKEKVDLLENIDQKYRDTLCNINRNHKNKTGLNFLEDNVQELHSNVVGFDDSRTLAGNKRPSDNFRKSFNNKCFEKMIKTFDHNSVEKEAEKEYNQKVFSDNITLEIKKSRLKGNFKRRFKIKQKLFIERLILPCYLLLVMSNYYSFKIDFRFPLTGNATLSAVQKQNYDDNMNINPLVLDQSKGTFSPQAN